MAQSRRTKRLIMLLLALCQSRLYCTLLRALSLIFPAVQPMPCAHKTEPGAKGSGSCVSCFLFTAFFVTFLKLFISDTNNRLAWGWFLALSIFLLSVMGRLGYEIIRDDDDESLSAVVFVHAALSGACLVAFLVLVMSETDKPLAWGLCAAVAFVSFFVFAYFDVKRRKKM